MLFSCVVRQNIKQLLEPFSEAEKKKLRSLAVHKFIFCIFRESFPILIETFSSVNENWFYVCGKTINIKDNF